MIDISIIIPVYKVQEYLPRCLESIIKQTFKNFEVILINDGSPDRSGEVCELYKKKDGRIKVIHQHNQGSGYARNVGLNLAKGEYIYFCDPDDYIEPNLLEDNVKLIKENCANLLIFGFYDETITKKNITKKVRTPGKSCFLQTSNEFRNNFEELFSNYLLYTLWNKIYKKSFLEKNLCVFDNAPIGEDTRFNYLVFKNLDKAILNNNTYYHYITQREGAATKSYNKQLFQIKYNELLKLEELLVTWNLVEKHQKIYLKECFNVLSSSVKNLFHKDCNLTDREKRNQINFYLNKPNIQEMLNNIFYIEVTDPLRVKIKKVLLKNLNKPFVYNILKYIY